ncbi:MAG: SpoIIE family protein phosphatase [Candidatus Eremiobacteraeota bacterium]|nr:SpoIIE family protein phosphatase [Candidatus Eremiobacteraeota bacterium]
MALNEGSSPPAHVVPVDEANRVGEARRAAAAMALALGFDESVAGRVALVATELATNLARHATGGQLIIQAADGPAVDLLAIDRGPGIANVARAMLDGYSSRGTSGTGLGAIRRQADAVDLYSHPVPSGMPVVPRPDGAPAPTGEGTVVWARCVRPANPVDMTHLLPARAPVADIAGVCVPVEGEQESGDAWAAVTAGGRLLVLVADGLGHGPAAAIASETAVSTFREFAATLAPAVLVERLHAALRATRGAAVAIATFDGARREIRFAGVGNVSGAVLTPAGSGLGTWTSHSMMSHNGTVGHQLRKVQELVYAWPTGSLVVFHTDGIRSRWQLDPYPGLGTRCPAVIAGVLWRDYSRGRDDATAVVVRDAPTAAANDRLAA